jgi:YesN/AraC family two-component response regulator
MKIEKITYIKHRKKKVAGKLNKTKITYNDLTIVLSGRLEYTISGKSYTVTPSDILFVKRGESRERHITDDVSEYVSFNFIADEPIELPTLMSDYTTPEINMLISVIDHLVENPIINSDEACKRLIESIIAILQAKSGNDSYNTITRSIIGYLHSHIHTQVKLEEIGEALRFSPIYCESIFKANIGKSIIDYFIELKMEFARRWLIENSLSLREISERLGFSDYNYFSRTFKKRTGTTPFDFRRKYT